MKPIDWRLREAILKRDNHQCQNCLKKGRLDVHHFIPVKRGGTDNPDNLISLCHPCHNIVELVPKKLNAQTISFRFKTAFWQTVRISAIKRKMTASELVEKAVNEFLKNDPC